MRVIFFGTPEFAIPSLMRLLQSHHKVLAVFTQPDRPAGRGRRLHQPPVKEVSGSAGVPVYQPQKIGDGEYRTVFDDLAADCLVVVAYGQLLPGWLLALPRFGAVNLHASLLPRYRGAAPIAWAILKGDSVTGVTTMLMDEGMDTGPILLQQEVALDPEWNARTLGERLADVGAELLLRSLAGLERASIAPRVQDPKDATYAPRITKDLAWISWKREAAEIHNQIRALNPWPLACSNFRGQKVQIFESLLRGPAPPLRNPEGSLIEITERGFLVLCGGRTVLEISELQVEGRRRVSGREFVNGARLQAGDVVFGEIQG